MSKFILKSWIAASVVALWALFAAVAFAQPNAAKKNIILFVCDDLSPDLGCYGNQAARTPHLDQLAAEGVKFRHAFATTASCSASRSVILTGLHNHANAQYGHEHAFHHFRAYEKTRSLPAMLRDAGYHTARTGKLHVGPPEVFAFDQVIGAVDRNAVEMAERCRTLLEAKSDKPFFLYFCPSDPHRSAGVVEGEPLKPNPFGNRPRGYPGVDERTFRPEEVEVPPFLPDTPTCRAELAQYYQSVSRIDQGVGRLVKILRDAGRLDDTWILFTSDHGIAFPGAKTTVYEPGLRVPLIVRGPGVRKANRTTEAMISHVDLVPTLLEMAGASPSRGELHGRSFLGVLNDEPAPTAGWDEVYASHTFHEVTMYYPMRVVRQGRYKLIWNLAAPLPFPFASDLWEAPTWQESLRKGPDSLYGRRTVKAYVQRAKFELYDLHADPDEVRNLADSPEHAERRKSLEDKLRAFQKRTSDPWLSKWDYE